MQRNSWTYSLLVLEELGSDTKAGETTQYSELKRKVVLLEAFRVRDMQVDVPVYLQDIEKHLQDHRSIGADERRQQLYSVGVYASRQEYFQKYSLANGYSRTI